MLSIILQHVAGASLQKLGACWGAAIANYWCRSWYRSLVVLQWKQFLVNRKQEATFVLMIVAQLIEGATFLAIIVCLLAIVL